ncbi:MAG: DUF2924 domain-containing protein [Alphaproteobacteria bacterium]
MSEGVLKQIAALAGMSSDELRAMWKDMLGDDPPPFNKQFLVRRLAYRLQELAFGGLAPATAARLDEMAEDLARTGTVKSRRAAAAPVVGTRLVREWQGETHEVTVITGGYEYRGRLFKSLSAIARQITGTRWNGPAFFGLRSNGGDR